MKKFATHKLLVLCTLLLGGVCFTSACIGTSICENEAPVCALAEGEYEPKSYTYTQEGVGVITVTLINQYECEIKLEMIGEEPQVIIANYSLSDNILTTVFGGKELVIKLNDLNGTFEEYIREEVAKNSWVNTFLTPLLSGVSIFSILTFVISLALAIKNHKNNVESKLNNIKSNENIGIILNKLLDVLGALEKSNNISQEASAQFKKSADELKGNLSEIIKNESTLARIQPMLVTLGELQLEIAKTSKEAVSSGVTQKAMELTNQIISMTKEG